MGSPTAADPTTVSPRLCIGIRRCGTPSPACPPPVCPIGACLGRRSSRRWRSIPSPAFCVQQDRTGRQEGTCAEDSDDARSHLPLPTRITFPARRTFPGKERICKCVSLTHVVDQGGNLCMTRGSHRFENHDARVLRFDIPCTRPEMPGAMEEEICTVVRQDDPSALSRVEKLMIVL